VVVTNRTPRRACTGQSRWPGWRIGSCR
jgi:hypothetical protein